MLESLAELRYGESAVHRRPELLLFHDPGQSLKTGAVPRSSNPDGRRMADGIENVDHGGFIRRITDQMNTTAEPEGGNGARQRRPAYNVHHDISSPALRQLNHLSRPLSRITSDEHFVGSDCPQPVDMPLISRHCYHLST